MRVCVYEHTCAHYVITSFTQNLPKAVFLFANQNGISKVQQMQQIRYWIHTRATYTGACCKSMYPITDLLHGVSVVNVRNIEVAIVDRLLYLLSIVAGCCAYCTKEL